MTGRWHTCCTAGILQWQNAIHTANGPFIVSAELQLPPDFATQVVSDIRSHLSTSQGAFIPDAASLHEVLRVGFWASLVRDEGRDPVFTMSIRPRDSESRVFGFDTPQPFEARRLAKLSMATDPNVSAIHVGPTTEGLRVFGIDTLLGTAAPVRVEVRGPGTLIIKSAAASVGVVALNRAELIERPLYEKYSFIYPGFPHEKDSKAREERLSSIVRTMFSNGRGSTLLIIPDDVSWRELDLEMQFQLAPAFDGLVLADTDSEQNSGSATTRRWALLRRERYIAAIAHTASVDGATVVTTSGRLLGFGAKILGWSSVVGGSASGMGALHVRRAIPTKHYEAQTVSLADFGGTRHQSAAAFVARCPGSMAVVASHDNKVSFLKSDSDPSLVNCLEHADWLF